MNLRLRNPLPGSREPWPLATRLARFALTALALAFFKVSEKMLQKLVERHAGLNDPQGLPDRPRQTAEWLCHIATGFLFLGLGYVLLGEGPWFAVLLAGGAVFAGVGWYLGRTVWGLPNAFRDGRGPIGEVFRRLVEVIRHGYP